MKTLLNSSADARPLGQDGIVLYRLKRKAKHPKVNSVILNPPSGPHGSLKVRRLSGVSSLELIEGIVRPMHRAADRRADGVGFRSAQRQFSVSRRYREADSMQ